MLKRRTLAALVALMGLSWSALPSMAAEGTYVFTDFAVPNPTRPATVRTLLTIDTSSIAGQTCQVVVDTVNGESVHPENYITVEGGVPTITVTGTEDGAFGVRQNATTVVMGDELIVRNHFQYATSVEGDVIITCTDDTTTTTTSPTTSTTSPESTTTTAPVGTTSTTTPNGSTTTIPVTSTTAPTGSTTSTQPPSTSTTIPPDSTTSTTAPTDSTSTSIITGSTATTVPPVTGSTLPFTGPPVEAARVAMAAAALLLLGGGVLLAGRES